MPLWSNHFSKNSMAFDAGAVVARIQADIGDFSKKMGEAQKTATKTMDGMRGSVDKFSSKLESGMKGYAAYAAGFTVAAGAGLAMMNKWVDAYGVQEQAEARLLQVGTEVAGMREDEVQALKDQASALQAVGVIGDELTIHGQSQLASFQLTSKELEQLTPRMLDLVVAEKGVNASMGDMQATANKLGKAVATGMIAPLAESGVLMSEAQQEAFKLADQQGRVALLAEILDGNYKGLNETMANTSAGAMVQFNNAWGDLLEVLGSGIAPIFASVAEKLQRFVEMLQNMNPNILQFVGYGVMIVTAFAAIAAAVLPVMGIIYGITTAFGLLLGAITLLFSPIGLLVAAVVALVVAWQQNMFGLRDIVDSVLTKIRDGFQAFVGFLQGTVMTQFGFVLDAMKFAAEGFMQFLSNVVLPAIKVIFDAVVAAVAWLREAWESDFMGIQTITTAIWDAIRLIFEQAMFTITEVLYAFGLLFKGEWGALWDTVKGIFKNILDTIIGVGAIFWDALKGLFSSGKDAISGLWSSAMDGLKDKAIGIWDSIKNAVRQKINSFITMINNMLAKVNAATGAVGIPAIPSIAMLAEGGIVTSPTLAMIGEGGESEAVIPLSKLDMLIGNTGSPNATVINNFNIDSVNSPDAARDMLEAAYRDMELT